MLAQKNKGNQNCEHWEGLYNRNNSGHFITKHGPNHDQSTQSKQHSRRKSREIRPKRETIRIISYQKNNYPEERLKNTYKKGQSQRTRRKSVDDKFIKNINYSRGGCCQYRYGNPRHQTLLSPLVFFLPHNTNQVRTIIYSKLKLSASYRVLFYNNIICPVRNQRLIGIS